VDVCLDWNTDVPTMCTQIRTSAPPALTAAPPGTSLIVGLGGPTASPATSTPAASAVGSLRALAALTASACFALALLA
jgi:hypothetical protein